MNNMPSMPAMPGLPKQEQNQSSGEAQNAPQAPFTEESVGNAADSDVGLNTPSHSEPEQPVVDPVSAVTPSIEVSKPAPANVVVPPQAPKGGIKVVATRKGFYNQMRYKEGDAFVIRSEEEFGEWFKCLDSFYESKRIQYLKDKKKAK